jgi:hypothetical protein
MWANRLLTRGIIVENGMVPHGPGVGCHVAPWVWCLKVCGIPQESIPRPPSRGNAFEKEAQSARHTMVLNIYMCVNIYLNSNVLSLMRGSGLGLSPSPCLYPYDHAIRAMAI